MKKLKNKKLILFGTCFLLLLAVSGVWAYFSATGVINNVFTTGNSQLKIEEEFSPLDQWLPGERKQKEVSFKNTGSSGMLLRFRVDMDLNEFKDGVLSQNAVEVPEKDGVPMFTWGQNAGNNTLKNDFQAVETTENGRTVTYYYYKKVLEKNDTTENVMDYVAFADWITNGNDKNDVDYQKSKANVTITAEMVQLSENNQAVKETWKMDYTDSAEGFVWSIWNPTPSTP